MRREVRKNGKRDLKKYAKRYNVTTAAVSMALNGKTFKAVDPIEPPILGPLPPARPPAKERVRGLPKPKILELVALRRSHPLQWTYSALAEKLRTETGLGYHRGLVAGLLKRFDPTLAELDKIKPYKEPKPPIPPKTKVCVICEETYQTRRKDSEVCQSKACRRTVEKSNAYERRQRSSAVSRDLYSP